MLENRAVIVQFLAGTRNIYLLQSIQISSQDHPVSYLIATGDSFLRGNLAEVCWSFTPSSTEFKNGWKYPSTTANGIIHPLHSVSTWLTQG